MEKSITLLADLLLSSTMIWGASMVQSETLKAREVITAPAETSAYCHMTFPGTGEQSLSWAHPVVVDGTVHAVDPDGSCDHDPVGMDAFQTQQPVLSGATHGYGE